MEIKKLINDTSAEITLPNTAESRTLPNWGHFISCIRLICNLRILTLTGWVPGFVWTFSNSPRLINMIRENSQKAMYGEKYCLSLNFTGFVAGLYVYWRCYAQFPAGLKLTRVQAQECFQFAQFAEVDNFSASIFYNYMPATGIEQALHGVARSLEKGKNFEDIIRIRLTYLRIIFGEKIYITIDEATKAYMNVVMCKEKPLESKLKRKAEKNEKNDNVDNQEPPVKRIRIE